MGTKNTAELTKATNELNMKLEEDEKVIFQVVVKLQALMDYLSSKGIIIPEEFNPFIKKTYEAYLQQAEETTNGEAGV